MTVEFKAGPPITNPHAFKTMDELRGALYGANSYLLNLFFEHCALNSSFAEIRSLLADIMFAQLGNDEEAVRRHIAAAIARTRFSLTDNSATRH